ncbi:MAG TPA: hypothetical protein V6D22_06050 [Candidatus Obscuribacterales bacterium]
MRRALTAALLAIGLTASSFTAALAAGNQCQAGAGRFGSFLVGWVVGTPISIVRTQIKDTRAFTHDFVGDSTNPLLWGLAAPLCLTSGVINGLMEGIAMAPVNAWKFSGTAPFSPETFSLGDIDK